MAAAGSRAGRRAQPPPWRALLVVATLGFMLAGLALAGWLMPHNWWPPVGVVWAAASLLLFLLFPHPWLMVGLALSLGTVWAISARWPFSLPGV